MDLEYPMKAIKFLIAVALSLFVGLPCFAGIAGKWDVTSVTAEGQQIKTVLTVAEAEGKLTATLKLGERDLPISNVALTGDQFSFRLMWGETGVAVKVKVAGDSLEGAWTADSGDTGSVKAVRASAAETASVPATIAGKWTITAPRADGTYMKIGMELKEEGGKWSASLTTPDGMTIPASSVEVAGNDLTMKVEPGQGTYTLKLTRDGANLKGTGTNPEGSAIPLTAAR
jgi:hypothetical protein